MDFKDIKFPKADNESVWNTAFEVNGDTQQAITTLNSNFERKLQKMLDENYVHKDKLKLVLKELDSGDIEWNSIDDAIDIFKNMIEELI